MTGYQCFAARAGLLETPIMPSYARSVSRLQRRALDGLDGLDGVGGDVTWDLQERMARLPNEPWDEPDRHVHIGSVIHI